MISSLMLHNFKAFEQVQIELCPLTIILGPNNSGKSALISALRLLAQTVQSSDSRIPLLLNGVFGDFGTYRDIVHKNVTKRHLELEISARPASLGIDHPYLKESENIKLSLRYQYRSVRRETILKDVSVRLNNRQILTTTYSRDTERQLLESVDGHRIPTPIKAKLSNSVNMMNFIPRILLYDMRMLGKDRLDNREWSYKNMENTLRTANAIGQQLYRLFSEVEYIGGMRLPPARTYLFTGEGRERVGAAGEYATSIMVMDSFRSGARSKNILQSVKEWFQRSEIAADVRVELISDRYYEVHLQHGETREYQSIADAGFGCSQVIPVLVAGYNARRGTTLIVEQPEIHLHPRAQAELGDFFQSLWDRQIQSIVETHSEHLVIRLQQHVASGNIQPSDIVFYYVYGQGDEKRIARMRIDELGKFIGEWPMGFFPERLAEATRLAQLRFKFEESKRASDGTRN